MATTSIKDGGVWRTPSHIYVKDGGVWRSATKVFVKDGGSWREVFTSALVVNPIPIYALGDTEYGLGASASVTFYQDGTLLGNGNNSSVGANWFLPTTAAIGNNYYAQLIVNSGSSPSTGTVTTPQLLSGGYTWEWSQAVPGTASANVTANISTDSGGTNIVGTATFGVNLYSYAGVIYFGGQIVDVEAGTTASAGWRFESNGTMSIEGNGTTFSGSGNWYGPTTPGIGSSYYVKCHNINNTATQTVGPGYDTYVSIGGGLQFQWQQTSVGGGAGYVQFMISTTGNDGGIVYTTSAISVLVQRTS